MEPRYDQAGFGRVRDVVGDLVDDRLTDWPTDERARNDLVEQAVQLVVTLDLTGAQCDRLCRLILAAYKIGRTHGTTAVLERMRSGSFG